MCKMLPLTVFASIFTAAAAVLWGMAVMGVWVFPVDSRAMPVVLAGAGTAAMIAAACWLTYGTRRRNGDTFQEREDRYLDIITAQSVRDAQGRGAHLAAAE